MSDDEEDWEDYCKGGYHPVKIGDEFSIGRYRVVRKLGWCVSPLLLSLSSKVIDKFKGAISRLSGWQKIISNYIFSIHSLVGGGRG